MGVWGKWDLEKKQFIISFSTQCKLTGNFCTKKGNNSLFCISNMYLAIGNFAGAFPIKLCKINKICSSAHLLSISIGISISSSAYMFICSSAKHQYRHKHQFIYFNVHLHLLNSLQIWPPGGSTCS